ncbi:hypothetical protein [Spiroplasma corruscae]|uniref:hypothetical protein n=1 Tax=Spiroplasma corruscae TaxID=216934 RepID=UPI000B8BBF87|nr:hypothetical protein [Spiroplasma corruscae]
MKAQGGIITDTIGAITTAVLAGKSIDNVDKLDMKIGNTSLSIDRTKLNEAKNKEHSWNWGSIV